MPGAVLTDAPAPAKIQIPDTAGTVLCFVCTGNTCRSPMAAAAAIALLRERGIYAVSAGLCVPAPAPIAANAVLALEARGIAATPDNNYRLHTATPLDEAILARADRVYGMTERHALAILTAYPRFAGKLAPLGASIPDPYGGELATYLAALDAILAAVKNL